MSDVQPSPSADLAAKIAGLVEEKGWNQEDFAKISGLNRQTVRMILQPTGERRLRNATVAACARALGLSVSELRAQPLEKLLIRIHEQPRFNGQSDEKVHRLYELATQPELKIMGIPPGQGARLYRGAGCSRCQRSGYYDRIGVFEFVAFDAGLAEMVTARAPTERMQQYAKEHGAVTLRDDALSKVLAGLTTLEEAVRVTIYSE